MDIGGDDRFINLNRTFDLLGVVWTAKQRLIMLIMGNQPTSTVKFMAVGWDPA